MWKAKDKDMRFKACFGASAEIVADIWNRIKVHGPIASGGEPKHLLWALIHLKVYSTVETHCALVGWPCSRTFAKWSWYFVERIAELKDDLISLDNRFGGLVDGEAHTNCFMSVDGTDCPIYEPWPFNPGMFSQKFNGPALKYEVGVCLKTGWIVWINGPFRGGLGDKDIFKDGGLGALLFPDEAIEVDKGYTGDDRYKTPGMGMTSQQRKMKSNARAQNEAVNGRLKQFNVLTTHFRHLKPNTAMMKKHKLCFNAVVVITQLKFQSGATVFAAGLDYNVRYL